MMSNVSEIKEFQISYKSPLMIFLSTPLAKSSMFSAMALLIKGPPSSKARDLKSLRNYVCLSTERLT